MQVIYVNDLPSIQSDMCKTFLYADDAKLYKSIANYDDANVLNKCCDNLTLWSQNWSMRLNIEKCKVMSFHVGHSKYRNVVDHQYCLHNNDATFCELDRVLC